MAKADKDLTISKWLQAQLKDKRMTALELADRAKIGRSTMYYYVDGDRVPSKEKLAQIAQALDVPIESVPAYTESKAGRPRGRKLLILKESKRV